jgi:hypothetical protein
MVTSFLHDGNGLRRRIEIQRIDFHTVRIREEINAGTLPVGGPGDAFVGEDPVPGGGQAEELFGRGIGQVRKALAEVMKEIADERGISLILLKATIVLANRELDITEEALRRLDK